jgi:hypothetical protein
VLVSLKIKGPETPALCLMPLFLLSSNLPIWTPQFRTALSTLT